MKLVDVRRLAIKKQLKIHFRLRNGMECIVNEDGVAQVPALRAIPDFNLEEELAEAGEFLMEPHPPAAPKSLKRAEMTALAADSPAAAVPHDHDDE
jgi:hypothetical protein